tara:strand:+ start:380 stop:1156 length:777 start_codon:yes stop_codon:yes gene_type:complete
MAVHLDIKDGEAGKKTLDGYEFTRIAIVTGVTGDGAEKQYSAMNTTGMPEIGDVHPARAGCYLRDISTDMVSTDTVRLRLRYTTSTATEQEYTPPSMNSIEVGGTVSQQETNVNIDGLKMTVSHTFAADYEYDDDWRSTTKPQDGTVTKLVPEISLIYSRSEAYSPADLAAWFVGKVNDGGWTYHSTAAASTWLCTGIVGRSNDNGANYTVTYSFQYRPDGWQPWVYYQDPHTGRPVSGGTGTQFSIYEQVNFNNLGL